MSVASASFLLFLLVVTIVFYICPMKHRWIVLLMASICFYLIAGVWKGLPFIILTSFVIWTGAKKIGDINHELNDELAAHPEFKRIDKIKLSKSYQKRSKKVLAACLVLCIGILIVTKFTKYVVVYMNQFVGAERFSAAWVIVPLGISYYTFSTAGYILDVYWKRYEAEQNFFRFFLYAIYFPHIVQGPISRYNLLGQELKKELKFDSQRILFGMELMIYGFFKKLVIADRLNIFINSVYDGANHPGSVFLVTMVFDALMIYTDFSGYMDIVRGASQIFGVKLEDNFNHPFFSRSVREFWRRWHMTLGGWFKDYLCMPLAVSKPVKTMSKKVMKKHGVKAGMNVSTMVPLIAVWICTGLWHGTGKGYFIWGVYYGILIAVSSAFEDEFQKLNEKLHINTKTYSFKLFQMVRTFCIFMGGRLLTSPGSIHATKIVIKNVLVNLQPWRFFDGTLLNYGLSWSGFMILGLSILTLWGVSMMQERFSVREKLSEQNLLFKGAILMLAIFVVLIFGVYGMGYDAASFVYMQY